MSFELEVQTLAKIGLHTHCLQNEDAHPNHALLGGVGFVHDGIEQTKDNEIVRAVRIDDKRSEAFVALQGLPKQNKHLGCPFHRFLTPGKIGVGDLHLHIELSATYVLQDECRAYWLIQDSGHAIHEKLKVLRPMQPAKIMAIIILRRGPTTVLGHWI